jgi:hypothetical protein
MITNTLIHFINVKKNTLKNDTGKKLAISTDIK